MVAPQPDGSSAPSQALSSSASSSSTSAASTTPYLTLNIPQALSLPEPEAPEKKRYDSVWDLFLHRANHELKDQVAAGFAELHEETGEDGGNWGCTSLTYGQLPGIACRIASTLRPQLEAASSKISPADPALAPLIPTPTVAIICPSGLDFFVYTLAIWSLGFALLPIAVGTTKEGTKNLIEKTGACAVLVHDSQKSIAAEVKQLFEEGKQRAPQIIDLQDTHDLVAGPTSSAEDRPVQSLFTPGPDSVLIIFHSSGSTGLPKPIYHINRFWSFSTAMAYGTDLGAYTTTPLYHGGMSDFLRALQAGSSLFFHPLVGSSSNTLSVGAILAGHKACAHKTRAPVKYFLSVPFILEMLSKDSAGLEYLASMEFVSTGGAPLPASVGDHLVHNGIPLVSRLGSSECGFLMSSYRDFENDKEWSWLRVEDAVTRSLLDFKEDKDNQGLFELVVTGKWPTKLLSNAADQAFSTEDLYSRHEEHDNWYKYATRVDDTLVLLNGKKFAAGLIESRLKQSELVQDSVVFGSNRALVGAVVIPAKGTNRSGDLSPGEKYDYLQALRPHMDGINKSLPSHARLTTGLIHVADESLAASIPRSSKGTLQRGHAYRQLSPLFDETYARFEEGEIEGFPSRESLQGDELRDFLAKMVGEILGCEGGEIKPDLDFYKAGMDSISSVRIKAAVHQHLDLGLDGNEHRRRLDTRNIYEHPTVNELAEFLEGFSFGGRTAHRSVTEEMRDMVDKYAKALPAFKPRPKTNGPRVAVLSGATGALGSHLLLTLLSSGEVDKVLCLVRASSDSAALQRVKESVSTRRLNEEMDKKWDQVACFAADLSDTAELGIPKNQGSSCDKIRTSFWSNVASASALRVVHAAWSVNFALSLKSFEADNIVGLANLLSFSLETGVESFVFCSSIASVLAQKSKQIHEKPSSDPTDAGVVGYSQSKWVAEGICSRLSASSGSERGMSISIARIGQLASDSVHGVWNESEAWPLMVRTAKEIGKLPEIEQAVDWLPVDLAARTLTEIALHPAGSQEPAIYHVLLPVDAMRSEDVPTWADFLDWLQRGDDQYKGLTFDEVPLRDWLVEIERKGSSVVRGRTLLEGIWSKLTPRGGASGLEPTIETIKTRRFSKTLSHDCKALDRHIVQKTVDVWGQDGFL
ncbi:acetyl-CoA synthetase-like protein [Microstroma glucosiphilum]|uniref:Acetyl-CoA synthetase-like protein n=1 Tax=Pseudomicrostroma glucosiphilum TaxID=1684307 RepID=A0A316UDW8_9BASI|nr:acetyl-CoA synthetase-like protein [Pseudomicrostroma glucosiphilum]PWN23457.1 acetyl-CoA synthetase-like protein [Pseudomicrostroma glucosiphilum]